eukprot:354364-Chlamydomonas_euryale.AAC.1
MRDLTSWPMRRAITLLQHAVLAAKTIVTADTTDSERSIHLGARRPGAARGSVNYLGADHLMDMDPPKTAPTTPATKRRAALSCKRRRLMPHSTLLLCTFTRTAEMFLPGTAEMFLLGTAEMFLPGTAEMFLPGTARKQSWVALLSLHTTSPLPRLLGSPLLLPPDLPPPPPSHHSRASSARSCYIGMCIGVEMLT